MYLRSTPFLVVTAIILILIPTVLFAGEFLYTGDALPLSSGQSWEIYHTSSNENGNGITSTVTADGGSNTWKLVDNSTTYRCSERTLTLGNVAFDTGATIAANVRCAANNSSSSYNIGISNGNVGGMALRIRTSDVCFTSLAGTAIGNAYTFTSDTTNYHRYYMSVKNATQGDNSSAVWNVYRDGTLVLTYSGAGTSEMYDGFYAGHYGTSGTGTWYFDWIACTVDGGFSPAQWNPSGPPPAPAVTLPTSGSSVVTPTPTVQWTTGGSDSYQVHINTTNVATDVDGWDSGTVAGSANSTATGFLANGTYYVFVRLHNTNGWGAWSAANYSFAVNAPTAPPAAPAVTSPTGTVPAHSVTVQWTVITHDAYEVHINTTNVATDTDGWASGQIVNSGSNCVSGTLANNTYYVFVRLRNVIGWGAWSASGNFTVYVPPVLPGAPNTITPPDSGNVLNQKPVIRWIGDPHTAYEVHINTTNVATDGSSWDSGQVSDTGDWCDGGVLTNGTYHVFVRLRNVDGWGPWSAGHTFNIAYTGADIKKGWIFLMDNQPYNLDVLSHAREYHVNHLELSHDIMMYAWQPIDNLTVRGNVNQLIDTAHANGVSEVVLWCHEWMLTDMPAQYIVGGKVNMDDPGLWTWLDSRYETLFQACPNADGLVFTFSETDADMDNRNVTIHTGKSPIDTYAQAIAAIWNVCKRHNKSLYIRTWGSDHWIRDGLLRCDPAIWMMSKCTGGGDWNVIQEDYDMLGTATGHPELEEFDFAGEYWGLTATPWAGIDFTKHLWSEYALPRGIKGMAARLARSGSGVYSSPNRINMTALDILADYPDINTSDIYSWWSSHWFGAGGTHMANSMKRTFDITNACYNLPTVYPTANYVASNDTRASIFDLDCISAQLKANTTFLSGTTAYDLFRGRLTTAAGMLGAAVPSTLFGDFTPTFSSQTTPTCSVTLVDAAVGLNPATFKVEYSTDGGNTWTNYLNFAVTADGGSTDAYHITANSIPLGQPRAARNKLRFTATNLSGGVYSQVFTLRGLDVGVATLGSSVFSDGLNHPQGGDGDTVSATMGGRACRTPASSADNNFYFQTDDGFAYDKSPSTIYLQVDYYGSAGSIQPVYDSKWRSDDPLAPVYLSGGTTWRTATWKLTDVNFGHRIPGGSDIRLYVGSAASVVYISEVRLLYSAPTGMLIQPANPRVTSVTTTGATVAWDAVPGATKYQVSRAGACVGWPTGTSFTDSGLAANTQYAYEVTAFDGSNNTSCATRNFYATTLAPAASGSTVTSSVAPATWQTSNTINFNAVSGFGAGKAAFYQYVWDESPTHVWTGNETTWPAIGTPPTTAGWNVWRATQSPVNQSPWLMYEGSTTQRCMSESNTLENGIPTWTMNDQGRVFGTKAKIGLWPNINISRDTGFTVTGRIKCIDEPSGWYNTSTNFGFNMLDAPDAGITIRPDYLEMDGPSVAGAGVSVANGYTYHTYTITMKNTTPGVSSTATYNVYRDGVLVTSLNQGPSGSTTWSGPFFGHWRSDAMGGWAWQWIAWNNTGAIAPSAGTTMTQLATHYGSSFYLHIRSCNSDGAANGTTDFGPYYYWNGATPLTPTVTDDGAYTTKNYIHAKWTAVGPSASYEYAIGTSVGGQQIVSFTNVGAALEITRTNLNLTDGQTYYVTIRGTIGSNSSTGSSDGITVAPMADTIGEAKALVDGAPAALYAKTVTAIFPTCAYVQSQDTMGIRVVTNKALAVGDVVDLAGLVSGSATEKQIASDVAVKTSTGNIDPPSMSGKSIGGSAFSYDAATGTGQCGVKAYCGLDGRRFFEDIPGANTIGSLIRTWGRVTMSAADCFFIDDGSDNDEYMNTGPGSPDGFKVSVPAGVTPPAVGKYAVVTGIISDYQLDGTLRRLLLVRQQSDIVVY